MGELAGDGQLQRERQDYLSASGLRERDEKRSTSAKGEDAVLG